MNPTPASLDRIDGISLVKFKERSEIKLPLAKGDDDKSVHLFLDVYSVLDPTPKVGSAQLKVLTGTIRAVASAPEKGRSYMLAYSLPRGKVHKVTIHPDREMGETSVVGDTGWVTGLCLVPCGRVTRCMPRPERYVNPFSYDPNPPRLTEDFGGTLLLTLADVLAGARSETDAYQTVQYIARLQPAEWGKRHFAAEPATHWCPDVFEPRAIAGLKHQSDLVKAQILGACSAMPGSKQGHVFFDQMVALDHAGKWPRIEIGDFKGVTNDEIASAATSSKYQRRFFFGSLAGPPSERYIKEFVRWLDGAPADFAVEILNRLAYWSARQDLKVRIAEKVEKNEQPVLLNREELTKLWKENPPAIRRDLFPGGLQPDH